MIDRQYVMHYDRAAEKWVDALPMGNGRLGAMVYGHTAIDRIQLNDDSLWYGGFIDRNNRAAKEKLPEIRRLVMAGQIREAEDLISQYLIGAPSTMRHYESLGELDIALNQKTPFVMSWLPNSDGAEDYHAQLDLLRGVVTVTHTRDGVTYKREMFCSFPDQVLAIRITADKPGAIDLNAQLDRCRIYDEKAPDGRRPGKMNRGGGWAGMLLDENHTVSPDTLLAKGHAAQVGFACAVHMDTDGRIEDPYTQLLTRDATCVCLYVASSTVNRAEDYVGQALQRVDAARAKGFDALLADHLADFETKMRRCLLDLGPASCEPTDVRLEKNRQGEADNDLAALYFTFGRYLMMAGGREGSAALNLQGIWCHEFVPCWDSKYTININTQMNYWPAENCNLSETHDSMFDLIKKMEQRGRDTARIMYGCRGAVCHHNTDFYGDCAPQDVYLAATSWVTGGAWMALHLWEHYQYTKDMDFLKEYRPVLRSFAEFFLDYLIENEKGQMVTCPSLSPENRYILPDGHDTPICTGPTMDNQILRALFDAAAQADTLTGQRDETTEELEAARKKLPPNGIGRDGRLLEWKEEVPELTPGMGHISHLWGVYPGTEINWKDTPELLKAAENSLNGRLDHGAGRGGWPLAWFICQHARMLDGVRAGENIRQMVHASPTRNFLNVGGVFQIDGNLGATAGIAEVLMQSHTGTVHLLPALPPEWENGEVQGLVARGGCTVDISWRKGALVQAVLTPKFDGPLSVRGASNVCCDGEAVPCEGKDGELCFAAQAGKRYTLT